MVTVVHIPLSELPDSQSLRDRIRDAEEIVLETADGPYRFTRERKTPGRTAAEMLADPAKWSNVSLDNDWARDMEEIIAMRKLDRDPWAE